MTLWEKVFRKKQKEVRAKEREEEPQEMPIEMPNLKGESLAIYNVLVGGVDRIQKEGITRVYLFSQEMEPDKNAFGQWIDTKRTAYYPYEMLDPREQEVILNRKHYSAGFLISDNVPGVIKHQNYGFEVVERTHIHPMLPELKKGGDTINKMNYFRSDCLYDSEQMKLIAEQMAKAGMTAQKISSLIEEGIKNYNQITPKLMEEAGVYKKLEQMDQRGLTPFEQINLPKANN